jgi:large subunit ribosomal protein L25
MTDIETLPAHPRGRPGKGGAREVRRQGQIPAIVYGDNQEPEMIALDSHMMAKQLRRSGFLNHIFEIVIDGRKQRVLPREVQTHPVTGAALHLDFLRVSATSEITINVAVVFVNEAQSPGLKRGGVLNVVSHEIEVICRPDAIPDSIEVDVSGLDIGDVIHGDQLKLPRRVRLAPGQGEETVASIAPPSTGEVAAPAETTEPTAG